jgi:hypothetical protein
MHLPHRIRIGKLGQLGEKLAAERLAANGFTDIEDLNRIRVHYPFGDLLATRDGVRYFIGVKARNEMRQGDVGLNESYNFVLISDAMNAKLKSEGKTIDQITALLLSEMTTLATAHKAIPAWITVPIRAKAGTYSAYFGLLTKLGSRRSIPMKPDDCKNHECLARDVADSRVTADLLNA